MKYRIATLLAMTLVAAVTLALFRNAETVGPLCLPLGLATIAVSLIGYRLAILGSPQKGTQLKPSLNPVIPMLHITTATGFLLLFCFIGYVVFDPYRFLCGD